MSLCQAGPAVMIGQAIGDFLGRPEKVVFIPQRLGNLRRRETMAQLPGVPLGDSSSGKATRHLQSDFGLNPNVGGDIPQ